jgi:hypothetical protein
LVIAGSRVHEQSVEFSGAVDKDEDAVDDVKYKVTEYDDAG